MDKKEIDELEREYYEGLFEHRRQVQEIYDKPLISGWELLIGLLILSVVIAISWRLG